MVRFGHSGCRLVALNSDKLRIKTMYVTLRQSCFKLDTFVYMVGLVMMILYLVLGVSSVVWFVFSQSQQSELQSGHSDQSNIESMKTSLMIMGILLVISLVGVLTSLLLSLGVKTQHMCLVYPWQVYHVMVVVVCIVGGVYQAIHFTLEGDTLLGWLSLFPLVTGIFLIFLSILTQQLAIRIRNNKTVSQPHTIQTDTERSGGYRSVKSIRTLKRKKGGGGRSLSMEYLETDSDGSNGEYWTPYRARSLPRHLDKMGGRDLAGGGQARGEQRVCLTDKVRRRGQGVREGVREGLREGVRSETLVRKARSNLRRVSDNTMASSVSLHSNKSVTIHPEVTQYRYRQSIVR